MPKALHDTGDTVFSAIYRFCVVQAVRRTGLLQVVGLALQSFCSWVLSAGKTGHDFYSPLQSSLVNYISTTLTVTPG